MKHVNIYLPTEEERDDFQALVESLEVEAVKIYNEEEE
jgi:hypothetical protein